MAMKPSPTMPSEHEHGTQGRGGNGQDTTQRASDHSLVFLSRSENLPSDSAVKPSLTLDYTVGDC